ncbi:DNA helicase UvrD [Pasteurella sp. PK-2025]|uniref:DNA helicase UvrD n=1 Tax=Pasteurella sp. PK-2025 TaxID=3413133 RepID=UPI003C78C8D5
MGVKFRKLNQWLYNVIIAIDQLVNAILGGWADETLSSRAYRGAMLEKQPRKRWRVIYRLIEALFFFEKNHCKTAYESELNRKQYPKEFRKWAGVCGKNNN